MSSWPKSDLATYTASPATFESERTTPASIALSGYLYRAIPHYSAEPLDSSQAMAAGGRWNRPGSFPVLYTGSAVEVVKAFVDWHATYYGLPLTARPPDQLPDLIVLSFTATLADAVNDAGLVHYGLPSTYPSGFPPQDHTATQPIGHAIFAAGLPGIAARSATLQSWAGPTASWADVAIFTSTAPQPALIDRFSYRQWYGA